MSKAVLVIVVFFVVSACSAERRKRNAIDDLGKTVWDTAKAVINCPVHVGTTVVKCQKQLEERLELSKKLEKEVQEKAPDGFVCCYVAEFNHCVSAGAEEACGAQLAALMKSTMNEMTKILVEKCNGYEYPTAKCYFFIYFWYLVTAALIVIMVFVTFKVIKCLS